MFGGTRGWLVVAVLAASAVALPGVAGRPAAGVGAAAPVAGPDAPVVWSTPMVAGSTLTVAGSTLTVAGSTAASPGASPAASPGSPSVGPSGGAPAGTVSPSATAGPTRGDPGRAGAVATPPRTNLQAVVDPVAVRVPGGIRVRVGVRNAGPRSITAPRGAAASLTLYIVNSLYIGRVRSLSGCYYQPETPPEGDPPVIAFPVSFFGCESGRTLRVGATHWESFVFPDMDVFSQAVWMWIFGYAEDPVSRDNRRDVRVRLGGSGDGGSGAGTGAGSGLPVTGTVPAPLVVAGLGMVGLGLLVVVLARRPRPRRGGAPPDRFRA